ncbi:MAG: hypothetical protein Q9175_001969 [Cornicularia normoerica]
MDSFAQVAAHLQPTLEFAAKLSLAIPVWILLIMADKHLLGLPPFEGSLWRSPRIPPRFTLKGGHGGEHAPRSKSVHHSAKASGPVHEEAAPLGPSPVERGFTNFATPCPQPSQAPPFPSNSLPMWSGTTALSVYQPLEVHDPFNSPSSWLVPCYVGSAVLLVLIIALAFLRTATKYRCFPTTTSQATQAGKNIHMETLSPNSLLLKDSLATSALMPPTQMLSLSNIISVQTPPSPPALPPPPPPQTLSFSTIISVQTPPSIPRPLPPFPPSALSLSAIVTIDSPPSTPLPTPSILGPPSITSAHSKPSTPAPNPHATPHRIPAESAQGSCEESSGENESTNSAKGGIADSKKKGDRDNGCKECKEDGKNENEKSIVDTTDTEEKREDYDGRSEKNASEAAEEGGKEDREEKRKGEIHKDGLSDSGDDLKNGDLDTTLVVGEVKKKKKRIRQNAKKRAAKRAAAEEASKMVGEASTAFCGNAKEGEEQGEKVKEVGEGSHSFPEDRKAPGIEEAMGKEIGKDTKASREDTEQHEDEEANEKNDANDAIEDEARVLPETVAGMPPETKKKTRRRQRKHGVNPRFVQNAGLPPPSAPFFTGPDSSSIVLALTQAGRSDERYQYFPERGARSRSSPPRSPSHSNHLYETDDEFLHRSDAYRD